MIARFPCRTFAKPLLLLLLGSLCPAHPGAAGSPSSARGPVEPPALVRVAPDHGGLGRMPDPVLLTGDTLPEGLLGSDIERLRVYAQHGGAMVPIRFQVDERTEEGDWVFPYGKRNNRDRGNGRLDGRDVLLFMARDAGLDAPVPLDLPGAEQVLPVELVDPVDGGRAWVYLARYPAGAAAPPPSPLPDYVLYDAEREIISSAFTRAEYIITEGGLHTTFYKHHSTPRPAGGSGTNLVDRLKFRVHLRFFNLVSASLNEERLGSDRVAYIQGPVRNLRRFEQFVKLPLGLRGVKTYVDVETYESFSSVPVTLHVPRGIHRVVSSATLQYGTDYSPGVAGSFFRNSQEEDALIVDGRMSEAEKRFPEEQDRWRIFYGPYGVLMTRTFFPPELLEFVRVRQGYLDDLGTPLPPERFPGSMGYAYTEIQVNAPRAGTYRMFLEFYFPPHYRPGDEQRYLHLRDNPLRIRIQGRETENPGHLEGRAGRGF